MWCKNLFWAWALGRMKKRTTERWIINIRTKFNYLKIVPRTDPDYKAQRRRSNPFRQN